MSDSHERSNLALLALDEDIRRDIVAMLDRHEYSPAVVSSIEGIVESPRGRGSGIVFLDLEAVRIYGIGIYSKIKSAYQGWKIVLLCDRSHRDQIKEAMDLGAYCCVLEPYAEWEIMTIVRQLQSSLQRKGRE